MHSLDLDERVETATEQCSTTDLSPGNATYVVGSYDRRDTSVPANASEREHRRILTGQWKIPIFCFTE